MANNKQVLNGKVIKNTESFKTLSGIIMANNKQVLNGKVLTSTSILTGQLHSEMSAPYYEVENTHGGNTIFIG